MSRNKYIFISEQYRQELTKYMKEHLERCKNYKNNLNKEPPSQAMEGSGKLFNA